jgi:tetratricopeptide (TPR) repeat protein
VSGPANDLARAKTMLDLRRYDEATGLLARIVAAEPADSRALCLLAVAHLGGGRWQDAATAARRAMALTPSDDWPFRLASMAEAQLGNAPAAVRAAQEACRLAPDRWQAHVCLARAALATEVDFAMAERAAAEARALAPDEPEAHYISGRVSHAQGMRREARAHHQRALALDPGHSGAMNELGRISLRAASNARAARHFLQAARSAPDVRAYSSNVEIVVRRVVAQTIYLASLASLALMYLTNVTHVARLVAVLWYAIIAVLGAAFGLAQLWRMPRETWPLFRRPRIALALGLVYTAIVIAMIVAAVIPARALTGAVLAATVVIFASRFAAYAILRPRRRRARAAGPG